MHFIHPSTIISLKAGQRMNGTNEQPPPPVIQLPESGAPEKSITSSSSASAAFS